MPNVGSFCVSCQACKEVPMIQVSSIQFVIHGPGRVPAASRALANGGARFLYREPQVAKFHS